MDISVTVISGYYNRASWVEQSLKSLSSQTFKNCEFLIFDDCSTDGTYDELLRCSEGDSRFRIVRNETNLGFTRSMKHYLNSAYGEYIAVHGSGDISHPTRLEQQKRFLDENSKCVLVACRTQKLDRKGVAVPARKLHGWVTQEQLLCKNQFFHGDVMYRRSVYESVGGYRPLFPVAADYDLWLRMTTLGDAYVLPEILYTAHTPPGTLSLNFRKRIEQKIVVGYCRKIVANSLSVNSQDQLASIDVSDDLLLKEDFKKLFISSLKKLHLGSAAYIARRYRELFETFV